MVDRFTITQGTDGWFNSILCDYETCIAQVSNPDIIDLCKLLNELHNENLKLKQQVQDYQRDSDVKLMKIIDDKLDEYLHRLNDFKKSKNPNKQRVERQISLHEAVITVLLEIKMEYQQ